MAKSPYSVSFDIVIVLRGDVTLTHDEFPSLAKTLSNVIETGTIAARYRIFVATVANSRVSGSSLRLWCLRFFVDFMPNCLRHSETKKTKCLFIRVISLLAYCLDKKGSSTPLCDAILIACGFVNHSIRSDHSVTLLETCGAHLFAKLSKSYRPRYGLTVQSSIDMPLPVIYDTVVDMYRVVFPSI